MIALVDCNNFYASCERLFRPDLVGKPVVVLSNNDGCAIARSQEAKDLGITMGIPWHMVKPEIQEQVTIFSSNYTLYADMSARVMNNLARFTPSVEVYSIDECFLGLHGFEDLESYGRLIRETVIRNTGIPVSAGIAPSKTLAKVANKLAKKGNGVCLLDTEERIKEALSKFPVEDLWGVGRQYAKKYAKYGIEFAVQIREKPLEWIQKEFTIQGVRMWYELQGKPVIPFGLFRERKKGICSSRSFGKSTDKLSDLIEAASSYASRIGEKLRDDKSCASVISVRLLTNRFREDLPQYYPGISIPLVYPCNNTPMIVHTAVKAVEGLYRPGYQFIKVEVMATGLIPEAEVQLDMFTNWKGSGFDKVSGLLDKLNAHYGQGTLRMASEGFEKSWNMKRGFLSPSYTTKWSDIIKVS